MKKKKKPKQEQRVGNAHGNHLNAIPSLLPEPPEKLPLQLIHQTNRRISLPLVPGAVSILARGALLAPLLAPRVGHVLVARAAAAGMETLRLARCADGGGGLGNEDCVGAFGSRGLWVAYVSGALGLLVPSSFSLKLLGMRCSGEGLGERCGWLLGMRDKAVR